jgi:uncharacterized protein
VKLRDKINADLTAAMKAQDAARLAVLRMMKTAIKLKETDVRAELEDSAVIQVLSTMIKQRKDSIEQFDKGGRPDLSAKEAAEIPVIEAYLPSGVSDEDIAAAVEDAVKATGASSVKDMGAVMKQAMAKLNASGKLVDGKKVNAAVKAKLENK